MHAAIEAPLCPDNIHAFAPPGAAADLEEGLALTPKFDADGLVTCVATDAGSGEVLMVAHMNAEALAKTIATGRGLVFQPLAPRALEKGRDVRPHPARRRDARRLRSGCGLDQGRAEPAAPATPAAAHASIARCRSARPARSRSNSATSACSIRRRFTRTPKTRWGKRLRSVEARPRRMIAL